MNRLGLRPDTLGALAGLLETPCLIMSHYACADEPAHPLNRAQLDAFGAAARMFPGVPTSLANTAGHFLGPEFLGDVTRPGIGLYGGGTSPCAESRFRTGPHT